nr:MAG TPA: hypothetical protein [Bacteriophage sp.]
MEIKLNSLEKLVIVTKLSTELDQADNKNITDIINKFSKLRELLDAYKKEIDNNDDVEVLNKLLEKVGNKSNPGVTHRIVYNSAGRPFAITEYRNKWIPYSFGWIFNWGEDTYVKIQPNNENEVTKHVFISPDGLIKINKEKK